ncbi:putative ER membrane protein complex subunit 7 [Helianthus annuus]|nr:putative ER membrane protein complex subunit 7 [Helianthus annuus]
MSEAYRTNDVLHCYSIDIVNGGGYSINGRVKIPGESISGFGAKGFGLPVKANNAKVILNGGQQVTFLKPDGYFSLYPTTLTIHLLPSISCLTLYKIKLQFNIRILTIYIGGN